MSDEDWRAAFRRTIDALKERRTALEAQQREVEAAGHQMQSIRALGYINEHHMQIEMLEYLVGDRDSLAVLDLTHPDDDLDA